MNAVKTHAGVIVATAVIVSFVHAVWRASDVVAPGTQETAIRAAQADPTPPATSETNALSNPKTASNPPSPELVDKVIEVADDIDPALGEQLRSICHTPDFERVMQESGRHLVGLARLRERDPALYHAKVQELRYDRKVAQLGVEYCRAVEGGDHAEAVRLKEEMQQLLSLQFALSMKVRGDSLLRLKSTMEKLEQDLATDGDKFQEIVSGRLDKIMSRFGSGSCD